MTKTMDKAMDKAFLPDITIRSNPETGKLRALHGNTPYGKMVAMLFMQWAQNDGDGMEMLSELDFTDKLFDYWQSNVSQDSCCVCWC